MTVPRAMMSAKLPNILLVVADCGRSDKWHGSGRTTITPNVDRFILESASFPCCISEKSCTSPSFTSLLTGLFAPRHGVHYVFGYQLPEGIRLLPELLAEVGYHTYAEATGPLLPELGLKLGFQHYEYRSPYDYLDTEWGDDFVARLHRGHFREPWFVMVHLWELHMTRRVLPEFRNEQSGRNTYEQSVSSLDSQLGRVFDAVDENTITVFSADHGETTPDETYRENTAVSYARDRLGIDQARGRPLYKVGWVAGPSVLHEFYGRFAPEIKDMRLEDVWPKPEFGFWARLRDRFRLASLLPFLYLRDWLSLAQPLKLTRVMHRRGLLDPLRAKRKVARLVNSAGHDRMIQMHMRMWINTYRVNMRDGHGVHVYDFLNRIPLAIRWPGRLPAGRVINRMTRQVDILPTILDLIGIEREKLADIDGRSFSGALGTNGWQPTPAYLSVSGFTADLELRGIRTEEYKYTYGPRNPELPVELYELKSDPREIHNVAADHPDLCEQLRDQVSGLMPATSEIDCQMLELSTNEQDRMETRLRDLGYID